MAGALVEQGLMGGQSLDPVMRSIESRPSGKLARRSWPDEKVGVWERVLKLRNVGS